MAPALAAHEVRSSGQRSRRSVSEHARLGGIIAARTSAALDTPAILERIDELLELRYRSADLGNLDDPLAETVYILLSQQAREAVYRRIFGNLRRRYPRWVDVLAAKPAQLEAALEPCGFQRQRTRHLRKLLSAVNAENALRGIGPYAKEPADLTLEFLHGMSAQQAERFLLGLPGIGPKTARCVLAYSLNRAAFPVDTNVHRIFQRLELVRSTGRKLDHDPFQSVVPERIRKRLHVNLVHHGRAVCRAQKPRCEDCVLVSFCVAGRRSVGSGDRRPVAIDLFAGAGGLGSGFRAAGFRVGLAVESERHAAQTYRANNPGVPVLETPIDDSTTAHGLKRAVPGLKSIAVLLAGPPCQGYSAAGTRDPHVAANLLYKHVARLASELRVGAVCIENVPGVRRVNGHGFIELIVEDFTNAGYPVKAHLLRACEYGVPQHRFRFFFLGTNASAATTITAPPASHKGQCGGTSSTLPPTPTLLAVLSRVPMVPSAFHTEPLITEGGKPLYNTATMKHSVRVIRKIERIRPGGGPISYRRLEPDEARTLIAGHRALPVHPELHRTISVREAALIQGFPNDYIFCGPRAEQPLQVANAVPPPMAEAVARHLLAALEKPRLVPRHGRRSSQR